MRKQTVGTQRQRVELVTFVSVNCYIEAKQTDVDCMEMASNTSQRLRLSYVGQKLSITHIVQFTASVNLRRAPGTTSPYVLTSFTACLGDIETCRYPTDPVLFLRSMTKLL